MRHWFAKTEAVPQSIPAGVHCANRKLSLALGPLLSQAKSVLAHHEQVIISGNEAGGFAISSPVAPRHKFPPLLDATTEAGRHSHAPAQARIRCADSLSICPFVYAGSWSQDPRIPGGGSSESHFVCRVVTLP